MAIWVEAQSIAYNIQGANLSPEHFANKKSEDKKAHPNTHGTHNFNSYRRKQYGSGHWEGERV